MPVRDLLISGLLVAALPFCLVSPFWGILMWTIVSLANPHEFMWTMRYAFPWAEAVAIPTLVGFLLFSRGWNRLLTKKMGLLLALWGWFTFTTVHNTGMPEFASFAQDTWSRWLSVSKILLMTAIMIGIVDTWARLRTLLLVIGGCLGVLVAKAVPFMILTGGSFRLYGPEGSMLADNNDFGLALNMTLPIFFFLARTDPNRHVRRVMTFLFIVTIPAIFFTYSRGALIGLSLVLLIMIAGLRHRIVLILVLLLAASFALFLTPQKWQDRMNFKDENALIDDSARSRLNAWTYCWRIALDYPITGAGFEAYTPELFSRYAPNPTDVHASHSIYFGVLAEHGFVGLALYLALILSSFLSLRKAQRLARYQGNEQAEGYAQMLRLGLIGFMVTGAFLGRAYFDYYFTLAGCAFILKRLCHTEIHEMAEVEFAAEEQMA